MTQADYKHWYDLRSWKRRRMHQLRIEPLCRMCLAKGDVVPARVADHVIPHRGDYNLFALGSLQSLCHDCHDRKKRAIELNGGFSSDCDEKGWPTDPKHPTYLRDSSREKESPP